MSRRFSPTVTVLCACLVALSVGRLIWLGVTQRSELSAADHAERVERQASHDLDVLTAIGFAPSWEAPLHLLVKGAELKELIQWHEQWAARPDGWAFRARLLILYGSANRLSDLRAAVDPSDPDLEVIASAYLGGATAEFEQQRDALRLEPWFEEELTLAWARQLGATAVAEQTATARAGRLAPVLWNIRLMTLLMWGVFASGVVALVRLIVKRSRTLSGTAPLPPAWSGADGAAVLARGGASAALLLASLEIPWWGGWVDATLGHAGTNLIFGSVMYLPLVALAKVRLLAPAGQSMRAGLGLQLRGASAWQLALIAVVGSLGFTFLVGQTGLFADTWQEWFNLSPLQGDGQPGWTALHVVGVGVILEELCWRGLVFGTLRAWFGFWPSALLSSAVFAAVHGYGLFASIDVLGAGVAFAWAYERSRSLWPGVLAHGLTNLLLLLTELLV